MAMITMTSLDAQSRFGELVDTAQREPVLITRRGRPVSIMISPAGGAQRMMTQFLQAVASVEPLRGADAVAEFERVAAKLGKVAKKEGLTEASLATLLDESGQ
jgi:antitoxin (DNA-binding transcriptional repressor) of toxin-antitoxin stability system